MSYRNTWQWLNGTRLSNCYANIPEDYIFKKEDSKIIVITPVEGYTIEPRLMSGEPHIANTDPNRTDSGLKINGVWDSETGSITFDISPMFDLDIKIGNKLSIKIVPWFLKGVVKEIGPEPEPEPEPTKLVMDYQSSDLVECWCNYTSGEEIVTTKNILIQPLDGVGFNENTLFPILINGVEYLPTVDTWGRLAYDTKLFDYEIEGTHNVTFKEPIVPVPIAYGYFRIWSGLSFINCSINYEVGEDVSLDKPLIIQADEGYEFLGDGYEVYTMNPSYDYDMINLGDKLYFEFTSVQVGSWNLGSPPNNEFKATPIPVREGKFTSSANLENCSINYVDGEDLKIGKSIKIEPIAGYVFKGSYDINLVDKEDNYYPLVNHRNYLEFIVTDEDLSLELVGDIIAVEDVVVSLSSFTDIFKISDSELSDLSKRRWLDTDLMPIDLGSYINNLYVFPVHLEDDLIGTRKEIYLGKYRTNVNSYIINSYEYVIDLGTIEVPEIYHNVYDYINTKCILHLPFFDKIYLNNEYVIGQSLYIEYIVNLYTGYVTMNIISSFTDEIIDSKNSLISVNIPFMQGTNIIGGFNNNSKNVISKAYVEVVRNIPYNVNTPFGKNVIEYGKLIDYNGYIECDNIQLNSSATNREKSDIATLLGKGVYINENK